jgi:hypothetical protein
VIDNDYEHSETLNPQHGPYRRDAWGWAQRRGPNQGLRTGRRLARGRPK